MEIWKEIKGYENLYQVSNLGRVKSLKRIVNHSRWGTQTIHEKILKTTIDKDGYVQVGLHKNNKQSTKTVHRLVAIAFCKNIENKPQVNHINGIKTDNRCENLEWNTISENGKHAYRTGLREGFKGEKNPSSKLTEKEVYEIKHENTSLNQRQLAKKYKVTFQLISKIKQNKMWKHV